MASNTEKTPDADLPADAPPEIRAVAAGQEINTGAEEKAALDWFLGATKPLEYSVPVDFETPAGMKKLIFNLRQVDSGRLEEIDEENRKGDGPFSKLDVQAFNVAAIVEATLSVTDETGNEVKLTDERFLGGIPSPDLALRTRFKYQGGLLEHVVDRIREKAGFSSDRVGAASRSLVEVGKP